MDKPAPSIVADHLHPEQLTLRITVVTETYPPEVNGVANTVERLVAGLRRRQHDVQLVRPRQHATDEPCSRPRLHEVLVGGLPIPRYPQLRMGVPCRRELVQLWSRRRPDIVHIATEGPLGFSALGAAEQLRLPVSSDFRTNFHAYSRHYGIGWLHRPIMAYLRAFHNRCALTMVPTEALARELRAAGFHHVEVVARGVDTTLFDPARRSVLLRAAWGVADEDLVATCVGRLAAEKNLSLLVRAFEAVCRVQPRARLLLVGDGPMRAALQRRLPRAIFAGQRRGEDLAAHYASADLFAFPSLTETFGNVTAEAMASGLPVLAFDHAAAAQMVRSGRNGLVVPPGDDNEFVRAAMQLAASPALRHTLGQGARRRALEQDWERVIARFEALTLQAMWQPARTGRGIAPATRAA